VARRDLAATITVDGSLGFGAERPVASAQDGRVTWLPGTGSVISRGEPLLRINDQPVVVFYGDTPLFRSLDTPNLVGRDVRVVADNLKALGYDIGSQPAVGSVVPASPGRAGGPATAGGQPSASADGAGSRPGSSPAPAPAAGRNQASTVRAGDAVFTTSMINAVRRWQARVGLPATGSIAIDDIVVMPKQVRVSAVIAQLGAPATERLLSVTDTEKVVTVEAETLQLGLIRAAASATVILSDGSIIAGTVTSVGRTATTTGNGGTPKVSITVSITDPATVPALDVTPVRVRFEAEVHRGVLTVPVGALLALQEGGYAVQIDGGGLVPVTIGIISMGTVEISGAGISDGTRVVTTA
jgi:peptidoglycan hydrolase-like protein with peptidoglycan-binding domain